MNTQPIVKPLLPDVPDYIFYKFDSLQPGKGFIIHEDNDPHSIYFRMLKEKGDTFSWEYLTVGPNKWSIKISKKEKDQSNETLGEMALSDHRKALILRKYGLDYSFKGNRTLKEACAEKEISTKNIERELAAAPYQSLVYTINYNGWEPDYLADFIVTNHHQYTKKTLLSIEDLLVTNSRLILQNYAELIPLVEMIKQLSVTMNTIMRLEEQILFPFIRFLAQATRSRILGNALPTGSVRDHIREIESEHAKLGEQVTFISRFTNHYTMPRIRHSFYDNLMQLLNEFDNDLHQHVHIENNILFKKALMLEQEYLTNAHLYNNEVDKNHPINNYIESLL